MRDRNKKKARGMAIVRVAGVLIYILRPTTTVYTTTQPYLLFLLIIDTLAGYICVRARSYSGSTGIGAVSYTHLTLPTTPYV